MPVSRESTCLNRAESSWVPVPMTRRGSKPPSFQIWVATTSQGLATVTHTPEKPARASTGMKRRAVSVV